MIRIDEVWLAVDPLDMRAGFDTALARVVTVCREPGFGRRRSDACRQPGNVAVVFDILDGDPQCDIAEHWVDASRREE